jgi:hypothetical protein
MPLFLGAKIAEMGLNHLAHLMRQRIETQGWKNCPLFTMVFCVKQQNGGGIAQEARSFAPTKKTAETKKAAQASGFRVDIYQVRGRRLCRIRRRRLPGPRPD